MPAWKGRGRRPTRLRLCQPTAKAVTVQIVCDFAFLRVVESRAGLPGPELWLVIRRNGDNPAKLKFYFSNAWAEVPLAHLIRLSGMR